jgi:hypothetical protein
MPSPTSRPSRKARAHAPSYVESIDLSEEEEEKATHGDGNYDSGSSTASFRSSSPSSVEEVRPSAKKGGRGLGAAIVKAKAGAAKGKPVSEATGTGAVGTGTGTGTTAAGAEDGVPPPPSPSPLPTGAEAMGGVSAAAAPAAPGNTLGESVDVVFPPGILNHCSATGSGPAECTVLVQIGPSDAASSLDFHGASGAVGRFEADPDGITMDFKGFQYRGILHPGPTALVASLGRAGQLRVEAITDEFVTLEKSHDQMARLDATVEGDLDESYRVAHDDVNASVRGGGGAAAAADAAGKASKSGVGAGAVSSRAPTKKRGKGAAGSTGGTTAASASSSSARKMRKAAPKKGPRAMK